MKTDLDDLPSYESNRNVRTIAQKYRHNSDVSYSHLKRWLKSKIGEKFEDVFSEWTKQHWLPPRLRNLEYFKTFVETEFVVDAKGELYAYSYGWARPLNNELYIDPDTQILSFAKPRKKVSYREKMKKEKEQIFRSLGDYEQLCKVDGVWFYISFKKYYTVARYDFTAEKIFNVTVPVKKGIEFIRDCCGFYDPSIESFKQLNSKELKRYNLKNDK